MAVSDIGDGTTIGFATSPFTAYVDSVSWSGQGREEIDLSHIGTTGGMPFLPSDMYDPGTLQLELHHNPDYTTIPLIGANEVITITFPNRGTSPATFVCNGNVQSYEFNSAKREKITASMTIKLTGTPTFNAGT